MPTTLILDIGGHAGIEALGGAGHMIFEGLGGAIRAALERGNRRFGIESRASRLAVLSVAYVLFAALCIQTVDRVLG